MKPPSLWRWLIGVHFFGRPIGWTHERYLAWLAQEAQRDADRRAALLEQGWTTSDGTRWRIAPDGSIYRVGPNPYLEPAEDRRRRIERGERA